MADDSITLSLVKSNEPYDIETLTFGKPESNKTIDVTITDKDGKPYNLTNKTIVFAEKFSDAGFGEIIDNGNSTNSGTFIRDPALDLQGKFKYRLQQNVFLGCGQAQFEFLQDGVVQDSTNLFNIDVQTKLDLGYSTNNGSYISDFASLLAHFKLTMSQASDKADQIIKDLQSKTNSAITSGQQSINDEVADSKTKIDDLIKKTQELIDSQTKSITDNGQKLSDLETAWDKISKEIQSKADEEIANLQTTFNAKMADLDSKAEDKINSIKQIEETEIRTKADKADTYTKAEVDNAVANAGKVKSVSVNGGDKTSPDDAGNVNITVSQPDLSVYAKTADVNTELGTKADKTDSYTKTEIDDKLAGITAGESKTKSVSVNGGDKVSPDETGNINITVAEPDLSPYAKTADINTELATKANATDVNNELATKASTEDIDKLNKDLALKADSATVTAELKKKADQETVDQALAGKADKTDSYTKTEIDDKLAGITAGESKTKSVSVNGGDKITPDEAGNINITVAEPDLSAYAKTADINTELAAKANVTDVDNKLADKASTEDINKLNKDLALKADSATVTTELGKKADQDTVNKALAGKADKTDSYTKTEIDDKLASAMADGGKTKSISVNGGDKVTPDETGNIDITVTEPDLSVYAKTADVNTELATKANTTDVDSKLATKANSADVDKSLADKANSSDVVPKTDFVNLQNQYTALKTDYDDLKGKLDTVTAELATTAKIKYFKSDSADAARDYSSKNPYSIAVVDDALASSTTSS